MARAQRSDDRPRATRWEIIGARLGIWTPGRDVEIPPVSRRAVVLSLAALAAGAAAIAFVVAPAIDRAKQETAAQEGRATAAAAARERARLRAEQRAHHGRSPAAARLHAAGRDAAAQAALLAAARADVARDARARVAAGLLDGPVLEVRCEQRDESARAAGTGARVQLDCLAITSELAPRGATGVEVGHPFVVAGSLRDGRYAWCKENPPPGEGLAGSGVFVPLPRACTR